MATVTENSTLVNIGETRFVLYNVGWEGYQALLKVVGDHGPRLTYSRGNVELMSPLMPHEGFSKRLGWIVETVAEELEIPIRPVRSMTLNRRDLDRGLEPDESYYIANVGRIGNQMEIDLEVDPPPDLAIEVEITSRILDKLEIYAQLRVPELWRFDGEMLSILILQADGTYLVSLQSVAFPFLPMDEVTRFLNDPLMSNESRWVRNFRRWVRDVIVPRYRNPDQPE